MTEENPLTIAELGAYTNNSMNREGIKKLVDKVNSGGGGTVDAYTKAETDALLEDKADADDVYDKTEVYTKTETDDLLDDKQDVLTAGTNITIENNVISATGGGSSGAWTKRTANNDWSDLFEASGSTGIKALKDIVISLGSNEKYPLFIPKNMVASSGFSFDGSTVETINNTKVAVSFTISIIKAIIPSSVTTISRFNYCVQLVNTEGTYTLSNSTVSDEVNKSLFAIYTRD